MSEIYESFLCVTGRVGLIGIVRTHSQLPQVGQSLINT